MIRFRTVVLLLFAVLAVSANRVLLRDVTSITLHRGQNTAGRRASPVPQLQCVGGTAQGKYSPKTVQCYNRGFDGLDPQWECTAEMPQEYQFGRISVTCEGYDHPNDPFVLAGSCGLKYELDYSTYGAKHSSTYSKSSDSINYTGIIYFVVIAFVLYLLYTTMTGTREGNEGDRNRGGGGGYWPGDDHGGSGPHPPGWRPNNQPPPSYDDTFKNTGNQRSGNAGASGSSSNYGFWSGAGLGALGGYLFNNWNRGGYNSGNAYRRRGPTQYERDTGFYSDSYDQPGPSHYRHSSPPSSSGTTHTSSGFGGTERR